MSVVCPHFGRRLELKTTLKRTHQDSTYFAVLDTINGLQVERVFLLSVYFKKGQQMDFCVMRCAVYGSTPKDRPQ